MIKSDFLWKLLTASPQLIALIFQLVIPETNAIFGLIFNALKDFKIIFIEIWKNKYFFF